MTKYSDLLFVGTNGDGLFLYDKGNFDKISIEHGMPSNNIVSLARSSDSTIWALTNGCLALVDWKNRNVIFQKLAIFRPTKKEFTKKYHFRL